MIKQFLIPPHNNSNRIEHGLGTKALIVNAWQEDHMITPGVVAVDKDTIVIYNMWNGGTVVIAAADPEKPSEEKKTSATRKPAVKRTPSK